MRLSGVTAVSLGELSGIDRDLQEREYYADHDGRAGEACEDFLFDPSRLAVSQVTRQFVATKNTDSLIGAVAQSAGGRRDSISRFHPLVEAAARARRGAITKRKPDSDEQRDIEYGRKIAHVLASLDLGQSVAADRAMRSGIEAMEGTDAMLRRAAKLGGRKETHTWSRHRRVRRHLLFDVPVIGPGTVDVMIQELNTTALAIDAGRTLMLDREELLVKANAAKIAIVGMEPGRRGKQTVNSSRRDRRGFIRKESCSRRAGKRPRRS